MIAEAVVGELRHFDFSQLLSFFFFICCISYSFEIQQFCWNRQYRYDANFIYLIVDRYVTCYFLLENWTLEKQSASTLSLLFLKTTSWSNADKNVTYLRILPDDMVGNFTCEWKILLNGRLSVGNLKCLPNK